MIPEPTLDFWVVLKVISVIQCVFFSSLILTTKNENPGAQKFLVLFLLVFALLETDDLLFHSDYIFKIPHWIGSVDPLAYSVGPLIYFYTCSLTNRRFSFRKHHLAYFLPLLVLYVAWMPVYLKSSASKLDYLLKVLNQGGNILQVAYPYNLFFATVFLAIFSAVVFLALSFYKLYQFNISIKQEYSSINSIHLSWLKFLLVLCSFLWFSSFLSLFFSSWALFVIDFFVFPIFIFLISYYDLRQKRIPLIVEEEKKETVKYAKSGIREEMVEALSSRLMHLIKHEKVYVQNELSLQELADLLDTSTHNLSQLLNDKMNQNFYEFINFHRVEEVKRRLAADEFKNLKILAIAFDSGFNSKTTFNATFRKYAGLSPTQYRKSLHAGKTSKLA